MSQWRRAPGHRRSSSCRVLRTRRIGHIHIDAGAAKALAGGRASLLPDDTVGAYAAEIGISTTRLHAYGPMGAEALTVERFVVRGAGQVRHTQSRA